jgi:SOS-response transcriptional repressor LexA
MSEFDPHTLAGRIERRLEVVGLSPSAASEKAMGDGKRDAIRKIYDKAKKNEPFSPRMDTIRALAKVLRTTASWLTDEVGPEELPDGNGHLEGPGVPHDGPKPTYAGNVQAGMFRAVDEYFNQDPEDVPDYVLMVPKYNRVRQYVWRSLGDSMDEAGILDGMWVVGADAADYIDTYGDIVTGDLVVVERVRYQGSERELTVKEVHFFRDRYELRPVSSNKDHTPIVVQHDHSVNGDDEEVKIIGVVLTAYANLRRTPGR